MVRCLCCSGGQWLPGQGQSVDEPDILSSLQGDGCISNDQTIKEYLLNRLLLEAYECVWCVGNILSLMCEIGNYRT